MELYQLRTFVTVIEEQSISGAARRLSMTPSSVSTHIKALETELGIQLFIRTHQGVDLTDKGRVIADHARETLQAADKLSQQAKAFKAQLVGQLRFGVSVSSAVFSLAPFIMQLNDIHPDIDVHLLQAESASVVHQLRTQSLDIGIVFGQVSDPTLKAMCLCQAQLVVAIPANWEQSIADSWESLADVPWINTGDDCPFHPIIQQLCTVQGIRPTYRLRINDEQTRCDLVRAGIGISLLEKSEANHPDITVFATDSIYCDVTLVFPTHRQFDPMIEAVHNILIQ